MNYNGTIRSFQIKSAVLNRILLIPLKRGGYVFFSKKTVGCYCWSERGRTTLVLFRSGAALPNGMCRRAHTLHSRIVNWEQPQNPLKYEPSDMSSYKWGPQWSLFKQTGTSLSDQEVSQWLQKYNSNSQYMPRPVAGLARRKRDDGRGHAMSHKIERGERKTSKVQRERDDEGDHICGTMWGQALLESLFVRATQTNLYKIGFGCSVNGFVNRKLTIWECCTSLNVQKRLNNSNTFLWESCETF